MGLGSFVADLLTGRHQPVADAAVALVERFEAEFGVDTGVRRAVVLSGSEGRYYPRDRWLIGATIRLYPAPLRSRALPELVFHEMGHAIAEHHAIGRHLRGFCRATHADAAGYEAATDAAALRARPPGYVSGYATADREEDFCETLAAYLTNRRTWRTALRFDGARVTVTGDARLARKLAAVHRLLPTLRGVAVSAAQ